MGRPEHVRAPRVVAPVTPNVVEHVALVIVVLPVTPRVPEHEAFTRLASPAQVSAPIVYIAVVLSANCRYAVVTSVTVALGTRDP